MSAHNTHRSEVMQGHLAAHLPEQVREENTKNTQPAGPWLGTLWLTHRGPKPPQGFHSQAPGSTTREGRKELADRTDARV